MKFTLFIFFLLVFTMVLLYVVGDRREPARVTVEQEVELIAR